MQIQHPTASLIARASTAQDDATGDGTTSTVLLIGELLKQADLRISEGKPPSVATRHTLSASLSINLLRLSAGLHPRILIEGYDVARVKALEVLDSMKIAIEATKKDLSDVARTSLRTKV